MGRQLEALDDRRCGHSPVPLNIEISDLEVAHTKQARNLPATDLPERDQNRKEDDRHRDLPEAWTDEDYEASHAS